MRFLLIGLGAALGANARYLIGLWAGTRLGADFPYGTLIVNVSGSLLLGFLLAVASQRISVSTELQLFVAVGFLGSFTTFSSFSVESLTLLRSSSPWLGVINVVLNNLFSVLSALLGVYLARLID